MAQRHSGGRPNKGLRGHLVTRPPMDLTEAVRAAAERSGLSYSDYIANVLADAHGFPQVVQPDRNQMKLTA